jgi:hypothetical protein
VAVNNMIPWGLLGQGVKAGLEIYKNKKKIGSCNVRSSIITRRKDEKR